MGFPFDCDNTVCVDKYNVYCSKIRFQNKMEQVAQVQAPSQDPPPPEEMAAAAVEGDGGGNQEPARDDGNGEAAVLGGGGQFCTANVVSSREEQLLG